MSQAQGNGAAAASLSLHDLRDPVICHMASFLPHRESLHLSMLSRLMLQWSARNEKACSVTVPKHRREDAIEVTEGDVLALRRRLSRGQGVCTHINVGLGCAMELLGQVFHQQPELGRQVETLEVGNGYYESEDCTNTLEMLTEMMQEDGLPCLRALKVNMVEYTEVFEEEVQEFFACLAQDACPQLEDLEFTDMPYAMLTWVDMALNHRSTACAHLKKLSLRIAEGSFALGQAAKGILAELLQAPCLSRLEHLYLDEARYQSLALPLYVNDGSAAHHLTELSLTVAGDEFKKEHGTKLMLALAAGKAPNLRKLRCESITFKGQALRELCDAIAEAGVLQHLEGLSIIGFESVDDALRLARAVGSGCPRLHAFKVDPKFQARALAALLRVSPHVALSEDRLEISEDSSLREIAEAVQHHRHGLPGLRKLSVWSLGGSTGPLALGEGSHDKGEPEEVISVLARLLERCPTMAHLSWDARQPHSRTLAAALAPGGVAATATRHLRQLYAADIGVDGVDAILQSLVAGACPQLHALCVSPARQGGQQAPTEELGSEAGQDALVALLGGQAPCASTLRDFRLGGYKLDKEHVWQLIEAFQAPQGQDALFCEDIHQRQKVARKSVCCDVTRAAPCLEWLGGLVPEGGLVAYIELLRALSDPGVGHRLNQFRLAFSNLSIDEFNSLDEEAASLINEGSWPRMPRDLPPAFWGAMLRRAGAGADDVVQTSFRQSSTSPATTGALMQRLREREELSRRMSAWN